MRIIRVFWGANRSLVRWDRLWIDVARQIRNGTACEQSVYVYGRENADRLKRLLDSHYKIELVSDDPYPFGIHDEIVPGINYLGQEGVLTRPWRYKHELLRCAIRDYGPVIYCDWDVQCLVKDVPAAFATLERDGFKLSAFRYKRREHHAPKREGYAKQIVASGSWIYTRDDWLIGQILSAMRQTDNPRHWHDEWVMSDLVDSWHGGWPGESVWLEKYESPIMVQQHQHSPWPLLSHNKVKNEMTRVTPVPFTWTVLFQARGKWRCEDGRFAPLPF